MVDVMLVAFRWRRYVSSGKIAFDYTANKWCRETICLIHVRVLRHIWETPSCMWYHNSVAKHNLNTTWGESLNDERVRMRESSSPIPSAEIKFYSVCSVRSVHFIHAYSLGMQKNFRTLIWSWRAKASESVESADLYIHSQTLMCNSLSLCVVSCGYRFYYAAHISGSFELQERLTNKFYLRIWIIILSVNAFIVNVECWRRRREREVLVAFGSNLTTVEIFRWRFFVHGTFW